MSFFFLHLLRQLKPFPIKSRSRNRFYVDPSPHPISNLLRQRKFNIDLKMTPLLVPLPPPQMFPQNLLLQVQEGVPIMGLCLGGRSRPHGGAVGWGWGSLSPGRASGWWLREQRAPELGGLDLAWGAQPEVGSLHGVGSALPPR